MGEERRQSGHVERRRSRGTEPELRQSLAKRLAAYALAAGGAGFGIMAGAQSAEAKIIYTDARIRFFLHASLDINGDGIADFFINQDFWVSQSTRSLRSFWSLYVSGASGNGVRGYKSADFASASRLSKGARIGASGAFYNRPVMAFAAFESNGPWKDDASGFLGLKFQIDGQTHYGWAEISIVHSEFYWGIVTGYAYNTVPNQPILAGQTSDGNFIGEMPLQPATLGLLAWGAPGLDVWRPHRRELAVE